MDLKKELSIAIAAAEAAGEVIRSHYKRDVSVEIKADQSPVTAADLEANQIIRQHLEQSFPTDAWLSEEDPDNHSRLKQSRVWIVDPLDGTKDFIEQSGDFAVHIGLVVDGQAVLGVVHKPIGSLTYYATQGQGAHVRDDQGDKGIQVSHCSAIDSFRVGVTRYAMNEPLKQWIEASGLKENVVPMGASIKMLAVATGDLEISVCLNRNEKEWDSCAPEVIVREAGGMTTDIYGRDLKYNQSDVRRLNGMLVSNGIQHERILELLQPHFEQCSD